MKPLTKVVLYLNRLACIQMKVSVIECKREDEGIFPEKSCSEPVDLELSSPYRRDLVTQEWQIVDCPFLIPGCVPGGIVTCIMVGIF